MGIRVSKSIRYLNGYRLIYLPEDECSMKSENWNGYIYEHIYFAHKMLKRKLNKDEVVHHLNGNKLDNRYSNLLVLSKAMHSKLHMWIDDGANIHESYIKNGMNSGKSKAIEPLYCKVCYITLQHKQKHTCSLKCLSLLKKNKNDNKRGIKKPPKEALELELKNNSMVSLGKKYGVSNNAVKKWAKKYNLL